MVEYVGVFCMHIFLGSVSDIGLGNASTRNYWKPPSSKHAGLGGPVYEAASCNVHQTVLEVVTAEDTGFSGTKWELASLMKKLFYLQTVIPLEVVNIYIITLAAQS